MFSVGDRVYDIEFGWGEVIEIDEFKELPIKVDFKKHGNRCVGYTYDGRLGHKSKLKRLSYEQYSLCGFSQIKRSDWYAYINKWGKFWDESDIESITIGRLGEYCEDKEHSFECFETGELFAYFKPFTEEQLEILGLTNVKEDLE